ncbi:hypothetical protein [Formosa sp. S-31]|uniref:hypothetical protein n=1 Tax=Formosa sp. S-31 TaxID=2790949 RepID=UPI003EC02481
MKKLLYSIAFLSSLFISAQNGYELSDLKYKEVSNKVNKLDSLTARAFADGIASAAATDYDFLTVKTIDNNSVYYYIPSELTPEEILDQKQMGCDKCMRVIFNVYYDGADKDLEIKGKQRLVFREVVGKFLDLYPTWNREFLPSATPELIKDSFKYRVVQNRNLDLNVRLDKVGGVWRIFNL